jgi:ABC-type spermidine/putrescine transport system permease subunit II
VVTLFTAGSQQTLPLWIYNQFRLPNTAPEATPSRSSSSR